MQLYYPALERQPSAFVSLATALDEYLAPPRIVVLRGERGAVAAWQSALARVYRPATLVVGIPQGIAAETRGLPVVLDKPPPTGAAAVNAWVCRGVSCLPPIGDAAELDRVLAEKAS